MGPKIGKIPAQGGGEALQQAAGMCNPHGWRYSKFAQIRLQETCSKNSDPMQPVEEF